MIHAITLHGGNAIVANGGWIKWFDLSLKPLPSRYEHVKHRKHTHQDWWYDSSGRILCRYSTDKGIEAKVCRQIRHTSLTTGTNEAKIQLLFFTYSTNMPRNFWNAKIWALEASWPLHSRKPSQAKLWMKHSPLKRSVWLVYCFTIWHASTTDRTLSTDVFCQSWN